MAELAKRIGTQIIIFIAVAFMAFTFVAVLINALGVFGIIPGDTGVMPAVYISLAISIALTAVIYKCIFSQNVTGLGIWMSRNISKIILAYVVISIGLVSIRPEVVISFETMQDMIGLAWSILGISMTIFVVWNVLIMQYLTKKRPQGQSHLIRHRTMFIYRRKGIILK
ncbi:MAG: hypothetical protein IJN83_02910 [Clostridia bacterium]|nr:hypothetical protein [Clostridia bacterium]